MKLYDPSAVSVARRVGLDPLNLNLLTTTIVAPPSNVSKWQMGFNSALKGLNMSGRKAQWLVCVCVRACVRCCLCRSQLSASCFVFINSFRVTKYRRNMRAGYVAVMVEERRDVCGV